MSSSPRFWFFMEGFVHLLTGKITVVGLQNLEKIPKGSKVIFATNHTEDINVPIAAAILARNFDIAIVDESTHHNFFAYPLVCLGIKIAGTKNFLPLDYVKDKNHVWRPGHFNPKNFEEMAKALNSGKSIVIAAHNPGRPIPEKAGWGAVYLAMKANAYIVPIAIDLKDTNLAKKPDVTVKIGKPTKLSPIDTEAIKQIASQDKKRFKAAKEKLRPHTNWLMTTLASMLPEEKRGIWDTNHQSL